MLTYDDNVKIKIIKVKDEFGNFSHWEYEVEFSNNWYKAGGTGPTFYGSIDEALDYIMEVAQYWSSSDANKK